MKRLLIVESPKKARTLAGFLGPGFEVLASYGHICDLPRDELGVDTSTLTPAYVVAPEKARALAALKAAAARADEVLLGTDPDREGEAIAWHLARLLRPKSYRRVRFHEISLKAVTAGIAAAGPLNQHLVDAQQARRIVDRLVGYPVTQALTSALGPNHSAGRVQTAALHLVVQREREREAFRKTPFWTLVAHYENGGVSRYALRNEKEELEEARLKDEAGASAVRARASGPHRVVKVETSPEEVRPRPPYRTSTLQQAASAAFGWSSDRTMEVAQALYESGLITYHRTDSVAVSEDAVRMARDFISQDCPAVLPSSPPVYRSKAGAQEAHEAIRPTSLAPLAADVSSEGRQLHELIRRRFLASQCKPAVIARTRVELESGGTWWLARAALVSFSGWQHYLPKVAEAEEASVEDAQLPALAQGSVLPVSRIEVESKETQPPPRYTEATLVAALERLRIGRPSTYATITGEKGILFRRAYLAREKAAILPAPRGRVVDELLSQALPELVAADYTARMEERLDEVAAGDRSWRQELLPWHSSFAPKVADAAALFSQLVRSRPEVAALLPEAPRPADMPCLRCKADTLHRREGPRGAYLSCVACSWKTDASSRPSSLECPECRGPMEEVTGARGPYARCLRRPECPGVRDLAPRVAEACPLCDGPMKDRGAFLGCERYPTCRGTIDAAALAKAKKAGRSCASCGLGHLLEKKVKERAFLGCSRYPRCSATQPLPEKPLRQPRRPRAPGGGPR